MPQLRPHLTNLTRHTSSRLPISSRHAFHTSSPYSSSPLFHLAALSNSRESRYFKRTSKLSQVEHSPNLQLIRSSEVEPFGGVRSIPGEAEGRPASSKRTITTPARPSITATSTQPETSTEQSYRTETPTERASRIRKIEAVATQEINRFATTLFPPAQHAAPLGQRPVDVTEDTEAEREQPWKHFGITEDEYAALETLEDGGGRRDVMRKKHKKEVGRMRAEGSGVLLGTAGAAEPDERLWGPGSETQYPLGKSDGEWMANVMQFRKEKRSSDATDDAYPSGERQYEEAMRTSNREISPLCSLATQNATIKALQAAGVGLNSLTAAARKDRACWTEAEVEELANVAQGPWNSSSRWTEREVSLIQRGIASVEKAKGRPATKSSQDEVEMLSRSIKGGSGRGLSTGGFSAGDGDRYGSGSGSGRSVQGGRGKGLRLVLASSILTGLIVWNVKPTAEPAVHDLESRTTRNTRRATEDAADEASLTAYMKHLELLDEHNRKVEHTKNIPETLRQQVADQDAVEIKRVMAMEAEKQMEWQMQMQAEEAETIARAKAVEEETKRAKKAGWFWE